jgi:selenocysteine lyase/cysteine desulfurase
VIDFFRQVSNIVILGNLDVARLPIFSFLIRNDRSGGLYLHPNFVTSLLNDLFGIQTRSGCACAGPYAQYLLGIDYELAKEYESVLIQDSRLNRKHLRLTTETTKAELLRPGFTRFNVAFFLSDDRINYILESIKFVCEHGWQFLPHYLFNLETGEWRHRNMQVRLYKYSQICLFRVM